MSAFLVAHPALATLVPLVAYLALSGAFTAAFSVHTPEAWTALAETSPRWASIVKAMEAAGLNLPALLRAAQSFAAAEAKASADQAKKDGLL